MARLEARALQRSPSSGWPEAPKPAAAFRASGLEWDASRALIDDYVPGSVAQAIKDADTFCGVDLPALSAWGFGSEDAAAVSQPVLSVLGAETGRLFVEGAALLRSWLPNVEELTVEGAGHLLQIQRPESVARGIAEFFSRHAIAAEPRQRH